MVRQRRTYIKYPGRELPALGLLGVRDCGDNEHGYLGVWLHDVQRSGGDGVIVLAITACKHFWSEDGFDLFWREWAVIMEGEPVVIGGMVPATGCNGRASHEEIV